MKMVMIQEPFNCPMCGSVATGFGWWGLFFWILVIAIIILVVVMIIAIPTSGNGPKKRKTLKRYYDDTPEEILRKRYAKGDITKKEYEDLKKELKK